MKKLYRSRRLRVIGGVAGGLSEYFDVDVTLIRLAIALLTVMTPNIIWAYFLAWIIIPEAPKTEASSGKTGAPAQVERRQEEVIPTQEKEESALSAEPGSQTAGEGLPPTAGEILAAAGIDQTPPPEGADVPEQAEQLTSEQAEREKPATCEGGEPAAEHTGHTPNTQSKPAVRSEEVDRNKQFFGYLLIAVGAVYLFKRYMPSYSFWFSLPVKFIKTWWPVVIILIGVAIVLSVVRRDS